MKTTIIAAMLWLSSIAPLMAHVPYLEAQDLSFDSPFRCRSAFQSIAVYAWLESEDDVDYYTFEVCRRVKFFAEVIVPAYSQYRDFRPSFALIGKGFPVPDESLPVELSHGYGAIVYHDEGLKKRPTFYESFGGKSYFQGPRLERVLERGEYTLIYWDSAGRKGDYAAAIGKYEIWRRGDIRRALEITPIIRRGGELHLKQTARD